MAAEGHEQSISSLVRVAKAVTVASGTLETAAQRDPKQLSTARYSVPHVLFGFKCGQPG